MTKYDSMRIPWPGWHITDELGEGGYGKVYKIERTRSGISEAAALKVISIPKSKTEYDDVRFTLNTDEEAEEYFTRKKERILGEIKTMQALKGCSNIVSIDDWTDLKKESGPGWDIYIRMELLTSFREWFTKKEASEDEIIKLGIDICSALVQCAKEGVIHRDIKPENILANKYGDYKLADFGISREVDHTTFVSRAGTPPYMSPEIYNGEEADRTVDIYSLGLVMYELLNDRRLPFVPAGKYSQKELQAAVQRRMNGEKIPAPANGSPGLKKIVLKACEHDPKDRYRTAGRMKRALEMLQNRMEESVDKGTEDAGPAVSAQAENDDNSWDDLTQTQGGSESYTGLAWKDESRKLIGVKLRKGTKTAYAEEMPEKNISEEPLTEERPALSTAKAIKKQFSKKQKKQVLLLAWIMIGLIIIAYVVYALFISGMRSNNKADALFKAYVQELCDNADTYVQGFPAYLSGVNTIHIKYAIADFDGDKSDELLLYSADRKNIDYYDEYTLAQEVVDVAYLTLYKVKDGEVTQVHSCNYNDMHVLPEDLTFLDRGIALGEDHDCLYELDLNGKNLEKGEFYDGSCLKIGDYNDPDGEMAKVWHELKENGKEVDAVFRSFEYLTSRETDKAEKDSITDKVPGLDAFIGGWAEKEDSESNWHLFITDDNGKLSIDILDGIYVFDAKDIRIENDNLICENGYGLSPSGNRMSDCVFRAYPDKSDENKCSFDFIYGGCYSFDPGSDLSKVAETRTEYDEYVGLRDWLLYQKSNGDKDAANQKTTDFSGYIGDYKEPLGDGSYYNELHVTDVRGDDIDFYINYYRLAGGNGKAFASGSDTASFCVIDGSAKSMTGKLVFEDDAIIVTLDEQEGLYGDISLSEYLEGLTHTFTREGE